MVSVYLMNILLQVLYISDLEYFSEGICILIVLPNIRTYLRFSLTFVQASFGMITIFVRLIVS